MTASSPICSPDKKRNEQIVLREDDSIDIRCDVIYSGNWAPVMKWQQDGGPVITDGRVVNNSIPYKSVTYSLTVRATRDMNGSKFLGSLHFAVTNKPSNTTATNIPDYSFNWTSPIIYVECENDFS